jgi:hypothetical protein
VSGVGAVSDIFREVDEDLRTERAQKLWARYGKLAIAASVALVLGVAGYSLWQQQSVERRMTAGMRYAEAETELARGNADQAAAGWGLLAQEAKGDGYALLARLRLAALAAERGDTAAAVNQYKAMSGDSSLSVEYRDLASLLGTQAESASLAPDALEAALKPLLADTHPLRHQARETLAAAFLKAGQIDSARTLLMAISDDAIAPTGLRARATELLAALGKAG